MNIEEKDNSSLVQKLHSRVKSTFEEFGLVSTKLIVGVSGGADSQTLLHILNSIKDELSLTLHGAHFNHGLRVPDSDYDAKIVEELFKAPKVIGYSIIERIIIIKFHHCIG